MSLADYLAKNYLTADTTSKKHSKKRKRKKGEEDGLIIADDDISGWDNVKKGDNEDAPVIVGNGSAEFRKAKKTGWQTVSRPVVDDSSAAADAIIAATTLENTLNGSEDVEPTISDDSASRMTSGARAGLQSAAQVTADIMASRAAELARFKAQGSAASGKGAETIYRDATGRIINVAMKRAELRAAAEAEEAKKKAIVEAAKGDAYARNKEARLRELEEAKFMTLARGVDDVEMNEELKAADRWNDPAAAFVTAKKSKQRGYQGAWAPNRYGIAPGDRWDGVDRANGFEKEWFLSRNRKARNKDLEYQWQMDE